jgi:2-C-methyl-D-erythritol 4-phosphate cytidylyltransferase
MHRFGHLEIVAVPGDAGNVKVTYPADLERVRRALSDPSGI